MQLCFSTFIPCVDRRSADADFADDTARRIENTVRSVAKTAKLGRDGQQALLQWSIWAAYATALTVYDPHLAQQPGWNIVLPIDEANRNANLHRLLLRAGESAQTALDAVAAFYKNDPIPSLQDAIDAFEGNLSSSAAGGVSLREAAWRQWLSSLPPNDLPEKIVPFEMLPAPFREVALFFTNLAGRDCRNTPGLNRLDLRYLHAPDADFQGCDLSGSNFFGANLSRSKLTNTRIGGTILPATARTSAYSFPASPHEPSTTPWSPKARQDERPYSDPIPAWREGMLI